MKKEDRKTWWLKKFGRVVRKDIESLRMYTDDLWGACALASYYFWEVAKKAGLNPKVAYGYYHKPLKMGRFISAHWWVEYSGNIYDITATQFGQKTKVFVVPKDSKLYELEGYTKKPLVLIKENQNIREEYFEKLDDRLSRTYKRNWVRYDSYC